MTTHAPVISTAINLAPERRKPQNAAMRKVISRARLCAWLARDLIQAIEEASPGTLGATDKTLPDQFEAALNELRGGEA